MATSTATATGNPKPTPTPEKAGVVQPDRLRLERANRASMVLKQAGDPTRLRMILILADGEESVGAVCSRLGKTQPAISHNLALLRLSGIITPRRQGKNVFYGLTDAGTDLAAVINGLMAGD